MCSTLLAGRVSASGTLQGGAKTPLEQFHMVPCLTQARQSSCPEPRAALQVIHLGLRQNLFAQQTLSGATSPMLQTQGSHWRPWIHFESLAVSASIKKTATTREEQMVVPSTQTTELPRQLERIRLLIGGYLNI